MFRNENNCGTIGLVFAAEKRRLIEGDDQDENESKLRNLGLSGDSV
jgi:hypothetical protein